MLNKLTFSKCFEQYFDAIRNYLYYRCGNSDIASDIAQDSFAKLWEKRATLSNEQHLKNLLYKMANDLLVSHWRRNKIIDEYQTGVKLKLELNSPDKQVQFNELKEQYERVLSQLPEKQRVVFMMNRIDGLTYREIAERLSLSTKAVEKRMSAAIREIKKQIKYP